MPLLNLADGQLAASSATLLGASGDGRERTVKVTLFNTSSSVTETVILTLLRSGSTARTIARAELGPRESLYLDGQGMDPTDILAGYASDASVVDYMIGAGGGPFSITVRDKTGAPKATQALTVTLPENENLTAGEYKIAGLLEEVKEVLLRIA